MASDASAKKGERVLVGFFTANTPDEVIADAIIAAHAAAKKLREDDQTANADPKPKDGPLNSD
jgi:hypothetical protein